MNQHGLTTCGYSIRGVGGGTGRLRFAVQIWVVCLPFQRGRGGCSNVPRAPSDADQTGGYLGALEGGRGSGRTGRGYPATKQKHTNNMSA